MPFADPEKRKAYKLAYYHAHKVKIEDYVVRIIHRGIKPYV